MIKALLLFQTFVTVTVVVPRGGYPAMPIVGFDSCVEAATYLNPDPGVTLNGESVVPVFELNQAPTECWQGVYETDAVRVPFLKPYASPRTDFTLAICPPGYVTSLGDFGEPIYGGYPSTIQCKINF